MLFNTPYYPFPTGYINATGYVRFDINKLKNFEIISINNNDIFYYDNPSEFGPPGFFNSTGVLIDIINNDIDTYNVKLTTGLNNTIFIQSLINGESGNNILLSSSNTGVIFNSSTLQGGKNLFSILKKPRYPLNLNNINLVSPPFTGIFSNLFYVTGFYTGFAKNAYLEGDINSFIAERKFDNIWNISTGFIDVLRHVDFKSNNFINNSGYYKINDEILNTKTPINVKIYYENNLSLDDNIDIAELIIKDLNAPTSVSNIIFRITGLT